ncbi:hypothetical protein COTV147 [Cotia virus SPAn232]|uniref:Uncharacterized protein n=2 Tax=Cotia virus TaxID=39444 RepID=H6TAB5_9POXV|nr:hypothetical protein COTV147 [Cotia virus SPAn232]AFB76949.1 hypothetical protein COTV147 [Cotia virus SPAn232]AIT70762.1 hypothetical protein [Cotia virus]
MEELSDKIINLIIDYNAKENDNGKDDFYNNFIVLCKEFIENKRSDNIKIKIINSLKKLPPSLVHKVWLPISLYCDNITNYYVNNKKWVENQINKLDPNDDLNITSYGNLARIAIVYRNDKIGKRVLDYINNVLKI